MNILLSVIGVSALFLPMTGGAEKEKPASDYILGANDQISVRSIVVKEIGEKSYRLDEQGDINLPLTGHLHAAGLTVRQLEKAVNQQFEQFYLEPQVAINISEYRGAPVSIIGAVGNPGVHQARGRRLLLEMLSAAGGIRPDAGPTVKITRQKKYGSIPLPGVQEAGDAYVAEVSVQSLVDATNPTENITIEADDVISIPRAEMVYIVGNVKRAGSLPLGGRRGLSVVEAVAMAEGFDPRAAPKHARILRPPRPGAPTTNAKLIGGREEIAVDLNKVLNGKAADVYLQPNDILFVPNSTAKTVTSRSVEAALQVGTGLLIFRR